MRRIGAPPLLFAVGCLLLLAGLWRIGASPERLREGLSRLGRLVALTWPPSPGGAFAEICHALGESLPMAFLGTLAKRFSQALEGADRRQVEAVHAAGAGWGSRCPTASGSTTGTRPPSSS